MSRKDFSKAHGRLIQAGQLWKDEHGVIRVMAVAEGYAMVRRKGYAPFIVSVRDMDAWEMAPKGSAP